VRKARVIRFLILALLVATAFIGLTNGPRDLPNVETAGQRVVAIAVTVYGVSALAMLYGLWRRKLWTRGASVLWALGVLTAATVAPVAYGEGEVPFGGVFMSAIIVAALVWSVVLYVFRDVSRAVSQR
jgi:peptidoglycan/LPS O-acetylase OafA/YrhL